MKQRGLIHIWVHLLTSWPGALALLTLFPWLGFQKKTRPPQRRWVHRMSVLPCTSSTVSPLSRSTWSGGHCTACSNRASSRYAVCSFCVGQCSILCAVAWYQAGTLCALFVLASAAYCVLLPGIKQVRCDLFLCWPVQHIACCCLVSSRYAVCSFCVGQCSILRAVAWHQAGTLCALFVLASAAYCVLLPGIKQVRCVLFLCWPVQHIVCCCLASSRYAVCSFCVGQCSILCAVAWHQAGTLCALFVLASAAYCVLLPGIKQVRCVLFLCWPVQHIVCCCLASSRYAVCSFCVGQCSILCAVAWHQAGTLCALFVLASAAYCVLLPGIKQVHCVLFLCWPVQHIVCCCLVSSRYAVNSFCVGQCSILCAVAWHQAGTL